MPGLSGSVGFDDVVAAAAAIGRGEMVVVSSFTCTAFSHQPICRPVANSVSRVLAKTRVWQTRNSWSSHQLIAAPTVVVVVVRQGNVACRARVHLANCTLKAKQALVSSCARLGLRCRYRLSDGPFHHHEHAHTTTTTCYGIHCAAHMKRIQTHHPRHRLYHTPDVQKGVFLDVLVRGGAWCWQGAARGIVIEQTCIRDGYLLYPNEGCTSLFRTHLRSACHTYSHPKVVHCGCVVVM